jgi:hypothetical protein
MATIIVPGRKPEPNQPWYLRDKLTCPECGCVFRLDEIDVEGTDGTAGVGPEWLVAATSRTPGGRQIIEGPCPDCRTKIMLTGRNGDQF